MKSAHRGVQMHAAGLGASLMRLCRMTVMARLIEEKILTLSLSAAGLLQLLLVHFGPAAWRCPFLDITGRQCPGCGMSRAFFHLLRGNWAAALRLHPFAPFFLMAWFLLLPTLLLPPRRRKKLAALVRSFERRTAATGIFLLTFSAHGLIRAVWGW